MPGQFPRVLRAATAGQWLICVWATAMKLGESQLLTIDQLSLVLMATECLVLAWLPTEVARNEGDLNG